jgi:uncharacterized protein YbjT (DUF2867 family)
MTESWTSMRRDRRLGRHQFVPEIADRHSKSNSCKETFIAEQVLNWSGLAVTHLRPTYFLEWLLYPFQLPLC